MLRFCLCNGMYGMCGMYGMYGMVCYVIVLYVCIKTPKFQVICQLCTHDFTILLLNFTCLSHKKKNSPANFVASFRLKWDLEAEGG